MPVRARLRFAEQAFPMAPTPIRSWPAFWEFYDSQRARNGEPPAPRPTGHNPGIIARARVDDGRWIADCPWMCGNAFNLPAGADWFWCTECAGGGWGNTAVLQWPDNMTQLTANLESLPVILQTWPCIGCRSRLGAGTSLCAACLGVQGVEV